MLKKTILMVIMTLIITSQAENKPFPLIDQLKENSHLPDPFTFLDGRPVKNMADWQERREEILKLMCHYIYGPACPQLNKYKIITRDEQKLDDGKVTKYTTSIGIGKDLSTPYSLTYYLPSDTSKAHSLFIFIGQKPDYKEEQALAVVKRGYGYCNNGVGSGTKAAELTYPEMTVTRTMGWVFGINEMINYLVTEHKIDKVIVAGCSRYGRTAMITTALNNRIDMLGSVTTLAHAVRFYSEEFKGGGNKKWSIPDYEKFKGKLKNLPVDRHFWSALIAPRPYLFIMGEEKEHFEQGHIEAHDAMVAIYKTFGVEKNVALYDHAPRGHGVDFSDQLTILDFADSIFYGRKLKRPRCLL